MEIANPAFGMAEMSTLTTINVGPVKADAAIKEAPASLRRIPVNEKNARVCETGL